MRSGMGMQIDWPMCLYSSRCSFHGSLIFFFCGLCSPYGKYWPQIHIHDDIVYTQTFPQKGQTIKFIALFYVLITLEFYIYYNGTRGDENIQCSLRDTIFGFSLMCAPVVPVHIIYIWSFEHTFTCMVFVIGRVYDLCTILWDTHLYQT